MLGQQTYEWKLEQGSKEEGPFELEETDEIQCIEPESHTPVRHRGTKLTLEAMHKKLSLVLHPYTNVEPEANYKELCLASYLYADIKCITTATQIAAEAVDKTIHPWWKLVLQGYHHYRGVFSETKAQHFPAIQLWDHAIDLKARRTRSTQFQDVSTTCRTTGSLG